MAEGMIEEFHRYLMEMVIEEADDKAFAHESGDNKLLSLPRRKRIYGENDFGRIRETVLAVREVR